MLNISVKNNIMYNKVIIIVDKSLYTVKRMQFECLY